MARASFEWPATVVIMVGIRRGALVAAWGDSIVVVSVDGRAVVECRLALAFSGGAAECLVFTTLDSGDGECISARLEYLVDGVGDGVSGLGIRSRVASFTEVV